MIKLSCQDWTRRRFMKFAVMLPLSASLAHFRLLAQTQAKKVKITDIQAMALNNIAGNCLIRIDTDSGLTGTAKLEQRGRSRGRGSRPSNRCLWERIHSRLKFIFNR